MFYQAERKNLEVSVTGDSLITRRLSPYTEPDFLALRDIIHQGDIRFTNMEVVLGEMPGYPNEFCGGNWLGVPTYIADELAWMGFNLFSGANNHGGDFGPEGALATLQEMRKRNLTIAGVGETLTRARQPGYMELGKGRVALLAASSSLPHGSSAGEQRQDAPGRPGVSPLHHEISIKAKAETIELLKRVADDTTLTALRTERIKNGSDKPDTEGEFKFVDTKFVVSETPGISTKPNEKDAAEILKWIRDARREADFVFFSLHAHESGLKHTQPAEFIETFCRAAIDAGADAVFGHGPHVLRGIEIYQGKPIMYSLGNFMMQSSTLQRVPAEMYTRYEVDAFTGTPADIWDKRLGKELIRQNRIYYESAVARLSWEDGKVTKFSLHPIHLGTDNARPIQGRPILARGDMAVKILKDLQELSAPYGTKIRIEGEVGYVEL
jgi:poly-gamma-glutamate capsule biosynthesis protein CapA/YwtB (metallophosphatase superfamily)